MVKVPLYQGREIRESIRINSTLVIITHNRGHSDIKCRDGELLNLKRHLQSIDAIFLIIIGKFTFTKRPG